MLGILDRLLGPSISAQGRAPHDDFWYTPLAGHGADTAGVTVTEETSLTYATVWACVDKLSKTLATLPKHVYEDMGNRRKRDASEQTLSDVIRYAPNPHMTAVEFWRCLWMNRFLWGNAYAVIDRDGARNAIGLYPIMSRHVTVDRNDSGEIVYRYRPEFEPETTFLAEKIFHLKGLSVNGLVGLTPIEIHRDTIGLGMGAAKHNASFLANGAIPGTVIERPIEAPKLDADGEANILNSFNRKHQGAGNHWKTALLRDGMTLRTIGMPLKDAQFLENRQFQRTEICAIYDVPPSKIHDDTRSTFSNVEQKNIDWMVDSIMPHCIDCEAALKRSFFLGKPFYVKHNMAGIVRGDIQTRMAAYAVGITNGIWSINDCREKEEDDPIEGGDSHYRPLNLVMVGSEADRQPASPAGKEPSRRKDDNDEQKTDLGPLFAAAADRIAAKEEKAIGTAMKRYAKKEDAGAFLAWLDKFYGEQTVFVTRIMAPVLAASGFDADASSVADSWITTSAATVRHYAESNPGALQGVLDNWTNTACQWAADQLSKLERDRHD